jgi:hypothetical protein
MSSLRAAGRIVIKVIGTDFKLGERWNHGHHQQQ